MDVPDYLLILNVPALLLFGLVTSYQDNKCGKIKNGWIAIAILYSLFTLGLTSAVLVAQGWSINTNYIRIYFINLLAALGFGILLWLVKLWSAGDAKLFTACAALIPVSVYKLGNAGVFPAYILMINTFTPIFLFFLVRIFTKLQPKIIWSELKKTLNPKLMLGYALFIFGFSTVIGWLMGLAGLPSNSIVNMMLLILVMVFLTRVVKVNLMLVSAAFSGIRLVLDFSNILSWGFWLRFALQLLFFMVVMYFVLSLAIKAFSKPIYVESLAPGMCLVEDIIEEKGEYKKKSFVSISFFQSIFEGLEKSKSILSDHRCLTEEDANLIKQLHSGGKIKDDIILINEKISFAVFMLVGVIITLLARGDVLFALRALLEKFI